MGGALARAVCREIAPESVVVANRTPQKAEALARELGCRCATNGEVAEKARFIMLGVKPQMMADMLSGIRQTLARRESRFVLVSMAAGLTMAKIAEMAGDTYPVIRIMPNTPASIGQGVILMDHNEYVRDDEREDFIRAISAAGFVDELDEKLIDAGSAVSGCGPAFAYMFIEALADGGVACGLPRRKAMDYAAKMLYGAAALVLDSGRHPGALKDDVCSPGGSTIAGVRALEEKSFRAACMDAVIKAFERTKALG